MKKLVCYFSFMGAFLLLFPFSSFSGRKAAVQALTLMQKERKLKSSLVIPYEVYVDEGNTLLFYNNDPAPREVLIRIFDGEDHLLFTQYATLTEEAVSVSLPEGYSDYVITLEDGFRQFEAYYSK